MVNGSSNATAKLNDIVNSSNVADIMAKINNYGLVDSSNNGGYLGMMIWLMIIPTLFIALKLRGNSTASSYVATSFVSFIFTLFLMALSLIPDWFLYLNIVLISVAGLVVVFMK